MKYFSIAFLLIFSISGFSQNQMTPEFLWKLGRVSGLGLSKDGRHVVYSVSTPDVVENKSKHETFVVSINGGASVQTFSQDSVLRDKNISPDGKYIVYNKEVKLLNVTGNDLYPELTKSNVYIIDNLNYRHWDKWNDGKFDHVFIAPLVNGKPGQEKDIMTGEPFYAPQKPYGGDEDYTWSPDSKYVVYVCKKKYGKDYALSTNTDLYLYSIETGTTKNLTQGMMGYDINPAYNKQGNLAWLSMKRDGFEADKQDLIIMRNGTRFNLTANRDDLHVDGFSWSNDGNHIYFWAAVKATEQLFETDVEEAPHIRQITNGEFQVSDIIGESNNTLIASRVDMNHAAELYAIDIANGSMKQLTHVNDNLYNTIGMCKAERRFIKTTDGLLMPTWVVYPPGFDAGENRDKKYPTLLFCLGGPQGTTPLYSFRWNFQLMASQGYIVVAPDRRGVFGNGTKWSQEISKDWGGQAIKDYLSAIDAISKEKYVDKNRLGCVGASYGGYSVYMLEALHNGRFKTFIAHDGLFDLKSWSGTTEELWFANWDIGGNYWDTKNKVAQKSFDKFSPSNFIDKWNTPIMIVQGGIDYRVPVEQGLQAFQAAQLKGIKSKLLYLPTENHWVLSAQNAMVWQHEFFKWLDETLK
ncbi:MAG: S9 family peptidase [Chitinophagaceae bacterium]|nr:S9 family peptidase [Chitinophagaceae bacterium]